ncbi:MAG: CobW family GTP-binding protein [Pseudanabaenaceae cyanobacterium]
MTLTNSKTAPESTLDLPKSGMPVTIITGFLGSGKTTLLNHILQNQQNLKVAVLVNEFGDINIDSQLLVAVDENMLELSNGCICCTINNGLVDAVYSVLERSERIDYMVIETTGVADPLPIALTFLGTELKYLTRLDSILTMIDAEQFDESHFESEAAFAQVMYGDIILLNKTDLVPEVKLVALENYINDVKTKARILRTNFGAVPLPLILDVNMDNALIQAALQEPADLHKHDHDHNHEHHHEPHATADHQTDHVCDASCDHDHDHHHHDHHHDHDHDHHSHHLDNDGFVAISFSRDAPFNLDQFQEFLDKQLPTDVFRAKGMLWFSNLPEQRYIFQLSGKRYELKTDERNTPKPAVNQLVLIGRNLNREQLLAQLEACLA